MVEPVPDMVALAVEFAKRSPCAKSRRGVVIYERGATVGDHVGAIVHGTGFNGPPEPFFCDKSEACRKDCGVVCMHAEMRALLAAMRSTSRKYLNIQLLAGQPTTPIEPLHLVHVKVNDAGEIVAGKRPCCELCSRMVLDCGIETVWLYEAAVETKVCIVHGVARDACPVGCLAPQTTIEIHEQGWRKYTAAEFQRATLQALKFHVSKLETVHRFYWQHRSRYCAACGEEESHPVHTL